MRDGQWVKMNWLLVRYSPLQTLVVVVSGLANYHYNAELVESAMQASLYPRHRTSPAAYLATTKQERCNVLCTLDFG